VCLDSYHIVANRTDLGLLQDIDRRKSSWFSCRISCGRAALAGGPHRHRAALPGLPGEGVHNEQVSELVRQVDDMGYRAITARGLNDDYRQLPLPMVCERAQALGKWVSDLVRDAACRWRRTSTSRG